MNLLEIKELKESIQENKKILKSTIDEQDRSLFNRLISEQQQFLKELKLIYTDKKQ